MTPETEYNSEYFLNRYKNRVNLVEEEEEKEEEEETQEVYDASYFINSYQKRANPITEEESQFQEEQLALQEEQDLKERVVSENVILENELEPQEVVIEESEPTYNSDYFVNKYKSRLKVQPTTELESGKLPTTAQQIQLGGKLERHTLGNLFRTAKAGLLTLSNNKSFQDNIKQIEKERTDKIFNTMQEEYGIDFRKNQNDAAVITGRIGTAVFDPVTFFIPWAKIARLGKITATATGAGIGATDMALYEYAAYGEVNPNNVLFGATVGGASSLLGTVVANRFPSVADDQINLGKINSPDADTIVKSSVKDEVPINLTAKETEDLDAVLPIVLKERAGILKEMESSTALSKMFTQARNDQAAWRKITDKNGDPQAKWDVDKRQWFPIKGSKITQAEIDRLNVARKEADKFLNDDFLYYFSNVSEGTGKIVDDTFRILSKDETYELTDSIIQKVLNETFRPLVGGGIGFTAGTFIGDDDDAINYSLIGAGMTFGVVYNRVKDAPYLLQNQKEKAFGLINNEATRVLHNFLKVKGSGTTATRGVNHGGENEWLSRNLFLMMDGKKKNIIGAEESSDFLKGLFGRQIADVIQNATEVERVASARIIKQLTTIDELKATGKYSDESLENIKNLISNADQFKTFLNTKYVEPVVSFKKIENYDLPQIWNDTYIRANRNEAENIIKRALQAEFPTWNKTAESLTESSNLNVAARRIVKNELGEDTQGVFAKPLKGVEDEEIFGKFVGIPQLKNYQKERVFKSLEARKILEPLLEQDLRVILEKWVTNTVPGVEFARRFGANGEIVDSLARSLRNRKNLTSKETQEKLKLMKNTVDAYFGVVGKSSSDVFQKNGWKDGFALLTFLSNTTMLPRALITQLGDFLQPFQNSGVGPTVKALMKTWQKQNPAALAGVGGSRSNTLGGTVKKDVEGVLSAGVHPSTPFQEKLSNLTQLFFRYNGMAPATDTGIKIAYSAGIDDLFRTAKKIGSKEKISRAVQNKLNFYGVDRADVVKLQKFKTVEKAIEEGDVIEGLINKIGNKASRRDVGLPGIGNRMIFAQHNNPMIKSAGLFLSWAQYKVAQMNGLINRVEDGDLKLAIKMLGTVGIFGGLRELQIMASPSRKYYEENEPKNFSSKWIAEATALSGIVDWRVEKLARVFSDWAGSGHGTATTAISPLYSLLDRWYNSIGKTSRNFKAGDYQGAAVSSIKTLPLGAEAVDYTNRLNEAITGETLLEDEPNIKRKQKGVSLVSRKDFSKGGLVGEETIEGPQVPFTQDNAADRINPITGLPYNQPLIKYQ